MPVAALVLPCLVGAAILFIPGTVILHSTRLPLLTSVGFAPAVGLLLALSAGAVDRALGLRSDLPIGLLCLLLIAGCVWVSARVVARRFGPVEDEPLAPRKVALALGVWAFAGVCFSVGFAATIGHADAWPQMPDNIFHVGSTTWMTRHGSAWLGDVAMYETGQQSFTYPGAWHVLVSLVSMWSGADALVASHSLVIIVGGFVWPASVSLLVWRALGASTQLVVVAPISALIFVGLPYRPLQWGVLWPFLLAMALLPLALCGALMATQRGAPHATASWSVGLGLSLTALAASVLAHQSALFVAAILVPVIALTSAWSRLRPAARLAAASVSVAGVVALWMVAPSAMVSASQSIPDSTLSDALVRVLLSLSPLLLLALGFLAVLAVGAVLAATQVELRWITFTVLVALVGVTVIPLLSAPVRGVLLWPWFGDYARLQAPLALAACLAVAVGTERLARRLGVQEGHGKRLAPWAGGGLAVAFAVVAAASATANFGIVGSAYQAAPGRPNWVSRAELGALKELARRIPTGSVVAADPLTGGTNLYRFRNISLLFPTEKSVANDPEALSLGRGLSAVLTDPSVCRLVHERHVTYVVSGGTPVDWGIPPSDFSGIQSVSQSRGFTSLASSGPYTLWRLPACTDAAASTGSL